MAAAPKQVVICFYPLLRQITDCLQFPEPVFQFLDVSKNNACVVVKTECGPIGYVYVGGEAGKVEESCGKAAPKVMCDLMKKYGVRVEDITFERREMYERCDGLYYLKRAELEGVEKGVSKVAMHEDACEDASEDIKHVSVDFVLILRLVVRQTGVLNTTVETIEHGPGQYTVWFTVTPPNSTAGFECIFSNRCCTLAAAKQSLAKKAVYYLMGVYNLEIVDANYAPSKLKFDAILCDLERESYLTVKERVLRIKEELRPSPLLVEQDCLTPRGALFQIPSLDSAPLPVKEHKLKLATTKRSVVVASESEVPIFFSVLCELETVFKRQKLASPLE